MSNAEPDKDIQISLSKGQWETLILALPFALEENHAIEGFYDEIEALIPQVKLQLEKQGIKS